MLTAAATRSSSSPRRWSWSIALSMDDMAGGYVKVA
jgi:hypothetical protein